MMNIQEWKFSWRKLRRSFGSSATTVLALAIAVGLNAAIYTLADNFLSAGRDDKYFLVGATFTDPKLDYFYMFDVRVLQAIEDQLKSFVSTARVATYECTLSNVGHPLLLNGLRVGGGSPDALPIEVSRGRKFVVADFDPSAEKTALLSHRVLVSAFGEGADGLGRLVSVNGVSYRIIGILPDDFSFHQEKFDLVSASSYREADFLGLGGPNIWLVGRLKDGVSARQATAEVKSFEPGLSALAPPRYFNDNTLKVRTVSGWSHSLSEMQVHVLILAGSVMLLLATLTLCSFALVRLTRRRSECATRAVMGARTWDLLRLFAIENGMAIFASYAIGVILGYSLIKAVTTSFSGAEVGLLALLSGYIQFNWRVVVLTLMVCLVVLGLISLTTFVVVSPKAITALLKEDSYSVTGGKTFKSVCNTLLFVQTSATCVIAIIGTFFLMSLERVTNYAYGYSFDGIVRTEIHLPYYHFASGERAPELTLMMNSLLESIRHVPEVSEVSASKLEFPHWGSMRGVRVSTTAPSLEEGRLPRVRIGFVSPGFLELIGLQRIKGETFSAADNRMDSGRVAIVNQAFTERFLEGNDPLNEFVEVDGTRNRIIGVVSDIRSWQRSNGLLEKDEAQPAIYLPSAYDRHKSHGYIYVKSKRWNAHLEQSIRQAIYQSNADVVVEEFGSLRQSIERSENTYRLIVFAETIVAILGCLLSCIAIYSAISYSVTQRKRETGVRLAMGATPQKIRDEVLLSTVRLVAPAIALGCGLSYLFLVRLRFFESQLYLVNVVESRVYIYISAALLTISILAGLQPAIKSASTNPTDLLRSG